MRLALAAILALLALPALAQDPIVYTGCLKSSNGTLYSVRVGTVPLSPCKAQDKQISWNMAGLPGPQGPPGPSIPRLLELTVDCSQEGASISAALAQQADKLIVSIAGTCVERVTIGRDDVTLQGVGTDPTIMAAPDVGVAVDISGAQRVILRDLSLTGAGVARTVLRANNGASVDAQNLRITGGSIGLDVGGNALVHVTDSEIANNNFIGVNVGSGASATVLKSSIVDNGGWGLWVEVGVAQMFESTVARHRNAGLVAFDSLAQFGLCTLEDNGQGIVAFLSHVDLGRSVMTGNGIELGGGSSAFVSDEISIQSNNGGIRVYGGSHLALGGSVTIDGGQQPGISLSDASTAGGGASLTVTGAPVGVSCAPPPAVAQLTGELILNGTTNCPRSE